MATTSLTVNVVKLPNDNAVTSAGSTGVVYSIPSSLIEYAVTASSVLTATQIAQYPGLVTIIYAKYFRKNQQLTGTWYVTQTLAQVLAAGAADLQSVHVLMRWDGTNAPGSGAAGTVYAIANQYLDSVTAATTAQVAAYPTAVTAISKRYFMNSQQNTGTMLVTESVASVATAAGIGSTGAGTVGDATLVAGTVAVTIPGVTTASKVLLTRHTVGGTVTATIEYQYAVTANTLTITAAVAAGTINTADTSVITYAVVA